VDKTFHAFTEINKCAKFYEANNCAFIDFPNLEVRDELFTPSFAVLFQDFLLGADNAPCWAVNLYDSDFEFLANPLCRIGIAVKVNL